MINRVSAVLGRANPARAMTIRHPRPARQEQQPRLAASRRRTLGWMLDPTVSSSTKRLSQPRPCSSLPNSRAEVFSAAAVATCG